MDAQELCYIGQRLFGKRWKAPLARELGVPRETLSRCAAGKQRVSPLLAKALSLLNEQPRPVRYRERRPQAQGEISYCSNAQLIHADCRTVVGLPQVDVILTDPVWPKASAALVGSHNPEQLFAEALAHLTPFLGPSGRIIVQLRCDSDPRMVRGVPRHYPFIRVAWLPYAVPSRQGRTLISGDVAYIFGQPPPVRTGNRVLPGQLPADFCPPARPTSKEASKHKHPCPRNLAHVEWLIEKYTAPDDVVLDPFMGSGTAGVAALRRGRRFIGIEIDRKYYLAAVHRLSQMTNDHDDSSGSLYL